MNVRPQKMFHEYHNGKVTASSSESTFLIWSLGLPIIIIIIINIIYVYIVIFVFTFFSFLRVARLISL